MPIEDVFFIHVINLNLSLIKDSLHVLIRSIIRSKTKNVKNAFNELI